VPATQETQLDYLIFFFLVVLGFELRASHLVGKFFLLSHSASAVLCWVFWRKGVENYFLWLASNHDFLISASQVVSTTGVHHQCLA
jgi:hypothetical protein